MKAKIGNLSLIIRNATKQDYQFCYRLTKQNMLQYFTKYWGGWKSEVFRKDFNPSTTKIILKDNIRVGYYVLKSGPLCCYVDNMQLSRLVRGKGVGTYLMRLLEKQALQQNKKKVQLTVFKDNPAIRLYKKLGYKIKKDKKTSVLMEKNL
jgi:GNAT superfamily N-acetyltransferase